MKLGTEDKTKVKVMVGLLAVVVLIVGYNLLSGPSSGGGRPNPGQTSTASQPKKAGETASSLDPTLRLDILRLSQSVAYNGGGRNIFRMEAASTPLPQVIGDVRGRNTPPPPPGPKDVPQAAPQEITLRFYGFANKPDEPKRVFLSDKGVQFLAREGEIVESRYKIVQIGNQVNNPSVTVEDVLTNYRKIIPLTAAPN